MRCSAVTVAGHSPQTDPFVASGGQTAFSLTQIPYDATAVHMSVNGINYKVGADYTIVGQNVTWNPGAAFTLKAGDIVEFDYNF